MVDYSPDEIAFLRAIDQYKRREQRPFPTWREVLAVLRSLGYRLVEPADPLPDFAAATSAQGGA